jgi:hypothetical protein
MKNRWFLIALTVLTFAAQAQAALLFDRAATWRWRPGTNEASSPVSAWRSIDFDDAAFATAPAPFWYDTTGDTSTLSGGTQIAGMISVYSCTFLRLPFVVTNVSEITGLRLGALVDDGFVAWINGTEVQRVNMPDPAGTGVTITNLAANATEPVPFVTYPLPPPSTYLVPGTNILAVQVFQSALASSDFDFDASLESILVETNPPTVLSVNPAPDSTVDTLTEITVTFSEAVTGVDAFDLRLNGAPAVAATPIGVSTYLFVFPQPAYGTVQISWDPTHGIADQALPPNPFDATGPGATWQYNLVDNTPPLVASVTPAAGSKVQSLTNIIVLFSEPVTGVDAADLHINGSPATGLIQSAPDFYTFSFPQPATGQVQVLWMTGHGITDLSPAANAFAGGNWIYTLDPSATISLPYISEFMASNTRTLADEDGDFSDWIEIYNPSGLPVNLDGWFLTDSTNNLTQWRFPATNLAGGKFLLVFASQKNRRVAGAPLHTSFRLSAGGEYLALVKPDGVTVVSEFSFPSQAADVSYGLGTLTTNQTVITSNTPVRVQVPPNGNEGLAWTLPAYDAGGWTLGTNGVGYGTTNATSADYGAGVLPTQPVGFWRLNEASGTTAGNAGSGAGLNGTYSSVTLGTAGPRPPQFNGFEANNTAPTFNGSSAYVAGSASLLSGRSAFSMAGWIKPAATPGSRIGLFGQNDCVEFGFISGLTIEAWTPGGGSFQVAYPFPLNTWHHVALVADGTNMRIFFDGALGGSGGTATSSYGTSSDKFNIGGGGIQDASGNFFNGQIDEVVVYHRALLTNEVTALYRSGLEPAVVAVTPYVRTDIGPAMSNVNASAYIRLPFIVDDPARVALLTLKMRYDDGFVAFVNGLEVARANAPETVAFNSAATNAHSPSSMDEFRIGGLALQSGTNILAIQGLNRAANDEDFLAQAELAITYVAASSSSPLYFSPATPGSENVGGVLYPGPSILEAAHTPNVPRDDQDVVVTALISPTFNAVSSVVLRYRIMFTNEIEVAMFDDGLHGDGPAGDGVYGAAIPASASTNGQMIRWFIRATDALGNQSRWPLFNAPADSAEYLGTVVDPSYVTSKLPIFHLFAAPGVLQAPRITPATTQTGADSENGGRVALFYDGELYDNIYMELRGNTSAGQNKKSHRVVFNREHRFRHLPGYPRVRKTSLMAEFLDPAYLRQHLCFWLLEQMGVPSPYFYPVRAQLNGAFYGLLFHNDVIDVEQVERMGYDPAGSLYKAAGQCIPAESSTGVFEKKAPEPLGDHTDYQALVRAINETNTLAGRRIAAFDMLDVPEVINYLAGARWCAENDDVWANMSLYRDTYGDQLWRIIPFDMNASWGQRYGGITPLDAIADNCKSHPLYGCSTIIACDGAVFNRVYDVVIQVPELRQMMLRRERTVLDRWVLEPAADPQSRLLESHIRYMTNLIWTEAFLDRASWGYSTWTASNKPLTNAVNELFNEFINLRRTHFSVTHNVTNVAKPIGISPTSNAGIPLSQPENASPRIVGLDYNPVSGNQQEEYVCLTNPAPMALDLSGWRLDGAVQFTFAQGTIMPSNTLLYVSPSVVAFRARATGPRGGQGNFVVGPYKGQLSARGETVVLKNDLGLAMTTNAYAGSPTPAQQCLRITEVMYHPSAEGVDPALAEELEYLEFKNISSTVTLNLNGVRLVNAVVFDFTGSAVTTLGPGQTVLVVRNTNAFAAYHGTGLPVAGQYSPYQLSNGGERLQLVDGTGEEVLDFSYDNVWYPVTDGLGFSLVIVDEQAEPDAWNQKSQWRPSGQAGGSPGANDPGPAALVPVVISEALTRTENPPPSDSIELYNPTATEADLGGWFLTDDFNTPKKYRIPDGTRLAGGSYLVFDESQFNSPPNADSSFALSAAGDEVYLFSGDGNTNLTGYYHGFQFGGAEDGVSFGRVVTSDGLDHLAPQVARSLGTNNAGPRVGPVVINEVMYHPPELGTIDNTVDEFIELLNITAEPVPLFEGTLWTNTWTVSGGVDFVFPTNLTLGAGQSLLLVNFDPGNAAQLTAFRSRYAVGTETLVLGPYGGKLNNPGNRIEIQKPSLVGGTNVVYVQVDEVNYLDGAPWPAGADGFGLSLQRRAAPGYGNEPTNWVAALPTAGGATATGGEGPSISGQPQSQTVVAYSSLTLSVTASGPGSLRYQWRWNGVNLAGATNAALTFASFQPENMGDYRVAVYNEYGSAVSSNATLSVVLPASILVGPQSQTVFPKTNASFSVLAFSASSLTYQWRHNSQDIPGANQSTYVIPSVEPADGGQYAVLVTDANGPLLSAPAQLTVTDHPLFSLQPTNRVLALGTNATSVTNVSAAYSTTPVRYQWLFNGTNLPGATGATLILSNVQVFHAGDYAVVATDNYGSSTSSIATLVVVVRPAIVQNPLPTTNVVLAGQDAVFTAQASGSEPLNVRWRRRGATFTNGVIANTFVTTPTNVLLTSILTVTNASYLNNGDYFDVNITNVAGTVTSARGYLVVTNGWPEITVQPTNLVVNAGSNATFVTKFMGNPAVTYQWWHNWTNLLAEDASPLSATAQTNSLTVTNVQATNEGEYVLILNNGFGSVTSAVATLTLRQPPVILVQPVSQVAVVGDTASFSVIVTGTPPFTYRWRFFGTNVPAAAATNATLTLTNVQAARVGEYSVVVSNLAGSTTSSVATLSVMTQPLRIDSIVAATGPTNPVTIGFAGLAGAEYAVEFRDELGSGAWQPVTNIPPLTVSQTVLVQDWESIGKPQRFYRILLLP